MSQLTDDNKEPKQPEPVTLREKIKKEFPSLSWDQIDTLIEIFNKEYDNLTCADCGSKEIIQFEKGQKNPFADIYSPYQLETIFDYITRKPNDLPGEKGIEKLREHTEKYLNEKFPDFEIKLKPFDFHKQALKHLIARGDRKGAKALKKMIPDLERQDINDNLQNVLKHVDYQFQKYGKEIQSIKIRLDLIEENIASLNTARTD